MRDTGIAFAIAGAGEVPPPRAAIFIRDALNVDGADVHIGMIQNLV